MKKLFIKEYKEKKLKEECVAEKISLPPNGNSEGRGVQKDGNFQGAVGVASRVFLQGAPSAIDEQAIGYFTVDRCFDSKQKFLLSWMIFYLH